MHVYRRVTLSDGRVVFRVGFYDPDATAERWTMVREFTVEDDAAAHVSFLNGGQRPPPTPQ